MSIRIYHTSDLHDHRGIVPRLRALRAAEPGLLFDCGDSLRGSQTMYYRREPIVDEIDAAGYDVQAMGNREFHYLFGAVRARVARMRHPLICSNLVDVRGRPLPYQDHWIREIDDGGVARRMHAIGLLVPQYPAGSRWERLFGWRFLVPYDVAAGYAARVADDAILVVLSHLGLRADRELAARVPRIDLILGGHSHDTLFEPLYVGAVPIVHAGPYGKFLSRTELDAGHGRARIARFDLLPLREAA